MAQAVASDGGQIPGLKDALKVDPNHSERNAHRLFNRYGLALRVTITQMEVPASSPEEYPIHIPYLRIQDYLKVLLGKYPEVLLGGLEVGSQSEALCRSFWSRYKAYHPQHAFFSKVKEEDWGFSVPLLIHGDKGRTLQKSPIFVLSFETPWGLPASLLKRTAFDNRCNAKKQFGDGKLKWTCHERLAFSGKRKHADMSACPMECPSRLDHESSPHTCHQRHNSKGHSYMSRFLVAAITSKVYSRNKAVLPTLLKEVAAQLNELLEHGLKHEASGSRFRFVFLGAKGDAEWHFEAGEFNRSYHNSSTKSENMICHLCEAGRPGLSFADCRDTPKWASTMGESEPWNQLPPLNAAIYSDHFPASMYKFDPFHVTKFGVFRDCVGSTVVRLCRMGYFDFEEGQSQSVESRLTRAFSKYQLWALASGKCITLKKFTKANFNYEKLRSFAWVNAKGSEVTLLMTWLDFYLRTVLHSPLKCHDDKTPLLAMHQMVQGGLTYIGIMHGHGVFMPASCARVQSDAGLAFIRGYAFLANYCTQHRIAGYRLRPKLHYFHHLVHEAQVQIRSGAPYILSSVMFLCEQNEDFIGRISRVSRRVSAMTAGYRTTQRYLVKVRCLLRRLLER